MRLLVTTDGSERSRQAFPHAAAFARAAGAEVTLLRVLNPLVDCADEPALSLPDAVAKVTERWQAELHGHADDFSNQATPRVEVKHRNEDTADAIVRVGGETDARVIILATRGTGFLRRALLGSVATRVLQHSPVPVMLVGAQIAPLMNTEPYHLLIAADGSDESEAVLPALNSVWSMAGPDTVTATVLHVYEPAGSAAPPNLTAASGWLQRFTDQVPARLSPHPELLVNESRRGVADAILDYARDSGAHAIWMATHGHSWRRHLLLGSLAFRMVERAQIPVVLVRA